MLAKQTLIEMQEFVQQHLNEIIMVQSQAHEFIENHISLDKIDNELEDFIKINRKPTLQQVLFSYIDRTGLSDPEVYKKAGIDRKHFSKIRSNSNYRP